MRFLSGMVSPAESPYGTTATRSSDCQAPTEEEKCEVRAAFHVHLCGTPV